MVVDLKTLPTSGQVKVPVGLGQSKMLLNQVGREVSLQSSPEISFRASMKMYFLSLVVKGMQALLTVILSKYMGE